MYSVALVLAFLSAENENRQLENLPQADFGRLPERLLLSVGTMSINENFVNWKLRPLLFLQSWFNAFFHLKSKRQRTLQLLFGDCRFIYFHSIMKSAFLLRKGLLCLYDKQNNTWNTSRVQLDVSLVRCAHSWAIELKLEKEIAYLRALMYYSLLLWDCHQLYSLGHFFLPYRIIFLHHQPIIIFNVLFYSWDRKCFEFYLDLSFFHNFFQRP